MTTPQAMGAASESPWTMISCTMHKLAVLVSHQQREIGTVRSNTLCDVVASARSGSHCIKQPVCVCMCVHVCGAQAGNNGTYHHHSTCTQLHLNK